MPYQELLEEGVFTRAQRTQLNTMLQALFNSPGIAEGQYNADLLFLTNKQLQFRDTGLKIYSTADGKLAIVSDGAGADDITLDGAVTVTDTLTMAAGKALALSAAGETMAAIARTATADGLTTGIVAPGPRLQHITVTSASADNIIALPDGNVGDIVALHVGANGYELRSSDPATISINGGSGATAESAIPAGALVLAFRVSPTAWLALQIGSDGTTAGVEAAA